MQKSIYIINNYLDKHWEDLLAKLPDNQIRYITIQVDYKTKQGTSKNDILLIAWYSFVFTFLSRVGRKFSITFI